MCAGNEGFYCMLYLLHFTYGPISKYSPRSSDIPDFDSCLSLAFSVPLIRVGLWQVMAVLCFPIAFVKTAISVVHLVTAAQTIAEIDVQERAAFGRAKGPTEHAD